MRQSLGRCRRRSGRLATVPFYLSRLPKPELLPSVVLDVLKRVASFPEVAFIVIFGSRAVGDANATSDVDLTVSAPAITEKRWLEVRKLVEEAPTLLWVTLIRFEHSPQELQRRNLREGVVIYESAKAEG